MSVIVNQEWRPGYLAQLHYTIDDIHWIIYTRDRHMVKLWHEMVKRYFPLAQTYAVFVK